MAADLYIHIFEGINEQDLRCFFSNTMGSKYFAPVTMAELDDEAHDRVAATEQAWIGEVSWLKAALFEDQSYIPDPVSAIHDLIGEELPELTEELAIGILQHLPDKPSTDARSGYGIAPRSQIEPFLLSHMGKRLFTVSW